MSRRRILATTGAAVLAGTVLLAAPAAHAGPVVSDEDTKPKILYFEDAYGNKYNDFGWTAHVYHQLMGYEEGEGDSFYWWLKDQEALWG